MEWWAYIWIFVSFAILLSILESFHRRARARRAAVVAEHDLQSQIVSQHQYVYTIQNNRCVPVVNQYSNGVIMRPQADDLPPKYEEVVVTTQIDNRQPQVHQPYIHQQRSAF
ncbi:hypothetical protein HA402_014048 [Bradysia odoriphaga]|nr:hypothetical protein HA402_014048 [Bradysia odoriphaga]